MTPTTDAGADGGAAGPGAPVTPEPSPADRDGLRRATAAAALLAVAVVATALTGPFRADFRPVSPEFLEQPFLDMPSPPTRPPEDANPFYEEIGRTAGDPLDLTWVGLVLVAVVVAAALYLLARVLQRRAWLRRSEGAPDDAGVTGGPTVAGPDVMPDVEALREGLDDAVGHLAAPTAPADAVVAAWVSLEEAAARSGVVRDPAQTPTEFTLLVLDRTPADREATRVLLTLYLRARFSEDPLTADDVASASAAVATLGRTLGDES